MTKKNAVSLIAATALCVLPTIAAAAGPFQYHAVTPCRVFDTRVTPPVGPLSNGAVHRKVIQGTCGIPVGAAAVTLNATVITPTLGGDLRIAPTGQPFPTVSTLNYLAGEPALANGAIVPLGPVATEVQDIKFAIGMIGSGTLHLAIDVTGYFQ